MALRDNQDIHRHLAYKDRRRSRNFTQEKEEEAFVT
jgi:hypothetical protein